MARVVARANASKILFRFRELLDQRADELAAIITAEHGKVTERRARRGRARPRGRRVRVRDPAAAQGRLLRGRVDARRRHSIRQPLGVVAIISPFNFPAMVPCWFFPIAIAAGNTVVLKPSEKDPSAANWIAELWAEAGLPAGVFNVVHGDKVAVDRLLEHPDVQGGLVRRLHADRALRLRDRDARGKRVQALGGAKNHMVVLPDADLDLAADAAVNAGFGSAGERCMAISVVVAVGAIADELVAKIAERIGGLTVGDGTRRRRHGPADHRARTATRSTSYLDAGVEAGATLVVDGREHAVARRRGRLLARPDAVRPRDARRWRSTPTRSSARCCRWCASTPTTTRSRS